MAYSARRSGALMVGRLLIWLVLAVVAWWILRPRRKAPPAAPPPRASASSAPAEAMVDCARCGLHLPDSEALRDAQARAYCSAAHRDAGPRSGQ
jgi:uncharacterized protein